MQRRTYSDEQKAEAMARVLGGESPAAVERDLDLSRGIVQKWMERDNVVVAAVAPVVAAPHARTRDEERAERLKDDLSDLLHVKMNSLMRQAEHYGSKEWLTSQPPERVLESTRTLWRNVAGALDRLAGRSEADAGEPAGD